MALQIKHDDYTPNWNGKELNLQALGLDQYDTVWGGTTSFDFARPDLIPNTIYNNDQLQSLRIGALSVIAKAVMAGNGTTPLYGTCHTDKGLPLYVNRGGLFELPTAFDLNTHGVTPSAIIYVWLKKTDADLTGIFGAGINYGRMNAAGSAQWIFGHQDGKFTFRVGSEAGSQVLTAPDVAPVGEFLLSIFIQKISSTRFIVHAYQNATKIGSFERAYPLNNPKSSNPTDYPLIGSSIGSSGQLKCILRRCGVRVVDPSAYGTTEHEAWIAEQIAANSPRFA